MRERVLFIVRYYATLVALFILYKLLFMMLKLNGLSPNKNDAPPSIVRNQ